MSVSRPSRSRQEDLAFFGTITASLSHQINNVLTIINELNGLIEDLLWTSENGTPIPPDRLRTVAERIAGNLERCTDYIRLLNRFAHSADHGEVVIDLGETVRLMDALSRRFVELRKATMVVDLPTHGVTVRTSPFHVLQALFICLQAALDAGGEGCALTLAVSVLGERATLTLECTGPAPKGAVASERLALLDTVCQQFGGDASYSDGRGSFSFQISLPCRSEQADEKEPR